MKFSPILRTYLVLTTPGLDLYLPRYIDIEGVPKLFGLAKNLAINKKCKIVVQSLWNLVKIFISCRSIVQIICKSCHSKAAEGRFWPTNAILGHEIAVSGLWSQVRGQKYLVYRDPSLPDFWESLFASNIGCVSNFQTFRQDLCF